MNQFDYHFWGSYSNDNFAPIEGPRNEIILSLSIDSSYADYSCNWIEKADSLFSGFLEGFLLKRKVILSGVFIWVDD